VILCEPAGSLVGSRVSTRLSEGVGRSTTFLMERFPWIWALGTWCRALGAGQKEKACTARFFFPRQPPDCDGYGLRATGYGQKTALRAFKLLWHACALPAARPPWCAPALLLPPTA